MEEQKQLFKGELMEELLRSFFLNSGYYVVRGIKYRYEGIDVTDIDLLLYGRTSSLTRHRINVDIKNKKSPLAFERIVWANGLMKMLDFDACIVATSDNRPVIQSFGQLHRTTILDRTFLQRLGSSLSGNRFSEEELLEKLGKHKSFHSFYNKDWRSLYEQSKSRLLTELDFSGFNSSLILLQYFLNKFILDEQKREISLRMVYAIASHLLIIVDFLLKDIAFLDQAQREKKLSDGFMFGNLGKEGVDKIIYMAAQISGNKAGSDILKSLEKIPTNILRDFFSKNENVKNVFTWAKDFEGLAFQKSLQLPAKVDVHLKALLGVLLDYLKIDRKRFFEPLELPKV